MFRFVVGQMVRALVSEQGLEMGKTYRVVKMRYRIGDTDASYTLKPILESVRRRLGRSAVSVVNGPHILTAQSTTEPDAAPPLFVGGAR